MNWNIRNDAPVYTQLVDQIARAIILGQFPPGSKLPSVRDFASDAGVNPNTMQRALAELERLELIRTQRTAGRTVTEDLARIDREKRLTYAELTKYLDADYDCDNGEYVRQMMLKSERYGGGNTLGDAWAVRVSKLWNSLVRDLVEQHWFSAQGYPERPQTGRADQSRRQPQWRLPQRRRRHRDVQFHCGHPARLRQHSAGAAGG